MGKDHQPTAGSSKAEKTTPWRYSPAATAFLKDYYYNTSKSPKKKEREWLLAHLKELGDTEVTDTRISNWFNHRRREDKRRSTLPSPTFAPDPTEKKWVDAHHETLWPSLTRETLDDLASLYADYLTRRVKGEVSDIPYGHWAEGLDAKPVHVRMWCRAQERQSKRKSCAGVTQVAEAPSQVTEEHSQLPTPGNSTSPEPLTASTLRSPSPPGAVKDEPPVSPVVATTWYQPPPETPETPKEKTSMGLHEAIESALSVPFCLQPPSTQPVKPLSTTGPNQPRKLSSRNSLGTLRIVPPPTQPQISAIDTTTPASASQPPTSISSPLQSEHFPPSPCAPLSSEDPAPGPSKEPVRDIAKERAALVTGVAEKLEEVKVMFSSAQGLLQFAGSTEDIARRNRQFLNDVSAGRFSHMRLTSSHLQAKSSLPEYNPLRLLAERKGSKWKGKEKETEDAMEVD